MLWLSIKTLIVAIIVVTISEVSGKFPRLGALLLSLPTMSVLAFTMTWLQTKNVNVISQLAKETLILIPLGLVFFVPLVFCEKLQLGFWTALLLGIIGTALLIGAYLWNS